MNACASLAATASVAPPAPVARLHEPSELVAALPYLLGFHPRDSLVVVTLRPGEPPTIGVVLRADLPPPGEEEAFAEQLCTPLAATGDGTVIIVVVGGPSCVPAAVAVLRAALQQLGVVVAHTVWAAATTPGAAWSTLDAPPAGRLPSGGSGPTDDSPPLHGGPCADGGSCADGSCGGDGGRRGDGGSRDGGGPCGGRGSCADRGGSCDCDDYGHAGGVWARCGGTVADPPAGVADAVGTAVFADRAELEQLVAPDDDAALQRRGALLDVAVEALAGRDEPTAALVADGVRLVRDAVDAASAGRLPEDDESIVRLAVALSEPLIRDRCLSLCLGATAAAAEKLWLALTRVTPEPEVAEPAVLAALSAYLRGDGALAATAVDRALQSWPGHNFATLLQGALYHAVPPHRMRQFVTDALADTDLTLADDHPRAGDTAAAAGDQAPDIRP